MRFSGISRGSRLAAVDQKETREILLVVLDAGLQNLAAISLGGATTCDPGGIRQAVG